MQICFILFLIDRHEMIRIYNTESPMNFTAAPGARGGAFGYFLGGYVPPGTPNWHPVLKKKSPKIDTPF